MADPCITMGCYLAPARMWLAARWWRINPDQSQQGELHTQGELIAAKPASISLQNTHQQTRFPRF